MVIKECSQVEVVDQVSDLVEEDLEAEVEEEIVMDNRDSIIDHSRETMFER